MPDYKTGWQMFRAMTPPWQNTSDPLVSYDLRQQRRAGLRPWSLLAMAYLLMGIVMLYLLITLAQNPSPYWDQIALSILGFLGGGLALMSMIGHWRLLMAISGRAASTIAGRRRSGDWDLIAITPLDKKRWYRNQLTIIAWQVFPITRQLLLIQGLLLLGGMAFLSYLLQDLRWEDQGGGFYSSSYLPLPLFWLVTLPMVFFVLIEPFWASALFAAVSLYTSSLSQRLSMSLLYTFLNVFLARYLLALVFYYGGLLVVFFVGNFAALFGADTQIHLDEFLTGSFLICGLLCIYALAGAFFLEWFPAFGILIFLLPNEGGATAFAFVSVLLTGLLSYVFAPLGLLRFFGNATIAKLNQRET